MTEPLDAPARTSKLSVASLALAIAGLAVFWPVMAAPYFSVQTVDGAVYLAAVAGGVILGVAAVVTGVIARRRARRGAPGRSGVALAGIVLGIMAAIAPAILIAFGVFGVYYSYEEFQECVKGSGQSYPNYLCLKECPSFLGSWCRSQIGW